MYIYVYIYVYIRHSTEHVRRQNIVVVGIGFTFTDNLTIYV